MTNRQRILTALACCNDPGDLPFLPWGLDALAAPPHPSYAPIFAALGGGAVTKRRWLGHPDFFMPAPPVSSYVQSAVRSPGETIETVQLSGPGGELTCVRQSIPGTSAREATSRFIKSEDDVRLYLSWPFADPPADAGPYFDLARGVGECGVVTYRISTALGVVGESFEPEPFALCSIENESLVLGLLEAINARVTCYVRALLEQGARPIFILGGPEFATPPLLSPRYFDDYVRRFDAPLIELMHSFGCRVIVHCHGRLDGVLERFAEMDVDGLHPLEAPPMGDVTLAEAARRVGKYICFVGNVQIGDMMAAEQAEIRAQVHAIRRLAAPGMILSTSATPYETVATDRLVQNYLAAIEAAAD